MVNPYGQVEKGRTFPPSLRPAFFFAHHRERGGQAPNLQEKEIVGGRLVRPRHIVFFYLLPKGLTMDPEILY